jgi:hypothetical protein
MQSATSAVPAGFFDTASGSSQPHASAAPTPAPSVAQAASTPAPKPPLNVKMSIAAALSAPAAGVCSVGSMRLPAAMQTKVANRNGRDFGWGSLTRAFRGARQFPSPGL